MNYLTWSLLALACYSLVAPLVSVAARDVPSDVAALVTNGVLVVGVAAVVVYRREPVVEHLSGPKAPYLYLAGLFLVVAILAYYRALALGPVSVVVPIFGMFIVTSSAVGVVLLDEALTLRKVAGVGLAVAAVYLTSGQ